MKLRRPTVLNDRSLTNQDFTFVWWTKKTIASLQAVPFSSPPNSPAVVLTLSHLFCGLPRRLNYSTSENTNNFTLLYTADERRQKFHFCRLPFAVNVMLKHLSIVLSFLKLSNSWSGQPKYCFKFAD